MSKMPQLFYALGVLALFLALGLWLLAGAGGADPGSGERWALFVAKWAPTLIGFGIAIAVHNLHRDLRRHMAAHHRTDRDGVEG